MREHVQRSPSKRKEGPDSVKIQYTLKGIEQETVTLMRDAAQQEGMKIGAWVSTRMKEAAMRALGSPEVDAGRNHALASTHQSSSETEERLRRIEEEIFEITKAQRAILTNLVEMKSLNHT
jgi:hypothetical protein